MRYFYDKEFDVNGGDSFEDFLKKNRSEDEKDLANAEARKEKWRASVKDLYDVFEKWLAPVLNEKLISLTRKPHELFEDFLGWYETEKMELYVGTQIIMLKPIGTFIMGSLGRIDFVGPRGMYMLILKDWGQWSISVRMSNNAKPDYLALDEKLFKTAIQDLIKGTHDVFG